MDKYVETDTLNDIDRYSETEGAIPVFTVDFENEIVSLQYR